MLGQLIEEARQLTIVDMEASVEHMSRGTVRHVDVLLIVVEPYYRALETAGRMAPLARDLGIGRIYAVANKVRGERDEAAVREYCAQHGIEVIACIPFDEAVGEADRAGMPAMDYDATSTAVGTIRELVDRLEIAAS